MVALVQKLGILPSSRLLLVNAPVDYSKLLHVDVAPLLCKKNETPDIVHLFVTGSVQLEKEMKKILPLASKNKKIVIWVSWYKKAAGIPTDVTEDVIRDYALSNGLVDVKVCAVSDIWSGLKLVVPLKLRG